MFSILCAVGHVGLGYLVRKYVLLFQWNPRWYKPRRKINLSTHRVLIETFMNRSALFGGWLFGNDVEYPSEVEVDARRWGTVEGD